MDEIKTSKKDLVCVSFFISFFVLAVAGFWVLCFVPAGHCREKLIVAGVVVLTGFIVSNRSFDFFLKNRTVGYESIRRFVDHFLFGFLILLLVFDLVSLILKRFWKNKEFCQKEQVSCLFFFVSKTD